MSQLPVAAILPELLSALQQAPQVLLTAPTGAGKTMVMAGTILYLFKGFESQWNENVR
mgnify:CR=1 FL=1